MTFYTPPGTPLHAQAAQDYRLHERAGAGVQFLGFDLRDRESPGVRLRGGRRGNPFRDPRVRAAIALAIDYPRLQRTAGGAHAVLASQVVAPYVLGFDSTLPEPRHAPGAARQLMAQSSHPDGFEVDLDVRALVSSYVPTIVESLAAIGIRVQPRTLPDEAYFEKLRAGGSSLYLLRYTSRTGDAQEMLDKMLHARDEARGHGVFNFSFDRPAVEGLDAAIEEARRTVEPARRLDRLRAVMRRVHEEHLMVPLLGEPSLVFTSRDVAFTPRADAYRIFAEMAPVSR